MPKFSVRPLFSVMAGLVTLGLSGPALAQQAPATPPAAAPQPPAPPTPTRSETTNHDKWTVTCLDYADGPVKRSCFALLQALRPNTNQVLFQWRIAYPEPKAAAPTGIIQTPTGVSVGKGISLKLGRANARIVPYTTCEPGFCTAEIVLDANVVRDLTATDMAEVVMVASSGQSLTFNVPVGGFAKALAALR